MYNKLNQHDYKSIVSQESFASLLSYERESDECEYSEPYDLTDEQKDYLQYQKYQEENENHDYGNYFMLN